MSVAFHDAGFCWMNGKVVGTEKALVPAMEPNPSWHCRGDRGLRGRRR
jgi:hypothetical protein